MRGWRSKLVFLLIVYFAGFVTAIYTLAPVPENRTRDKSFAGSVFKSDEFAQSFNTGMHKCLDFGKDVACSVGRFIKQKYNDRQLRTDG